MTFNLFYLGIGTLYVVVDVADHRFAFYLTNTIY